jgi:hypothetical protein
MRFSILQNGLQVKYWFFFIFKSMIAKKICMYYQIMHIIVIIYQNFTIIKVGMNTTFNNDFQIYLLTFFIILIFFKFCI